ncbi:MAG: phosphoethanolamine methyltransferase [Deltaproteobacteria bacterium RIFOXYD12_FULL_57_12]|nr:MAG: phosphoethanolamine methyltransferase [Deltaproteobacteria bacterium RIFOXYD12_FULL_57_12]
MNKTFCKNRLRSLVRITAKERLRQFLEIFQKEDDVLVVINADPDALACALAVKRLLRFRVKSVTIGYPNEIRRLSNLAMIELLKIQAERLQNLKTGSYSKRVMLDSQPSHLPIFEKIPFDAVIDHHPLSNGWEARFMDIRPEYGAASSMLVEYLRAAGMKPSVSLATAMFYAIKVDTRNFEKKAKLADAISFRYLFNIANQNLVRKIELSALRVSELSYFRTALAEMKISQQRLYVHVGRVRNPDVQVIIADFLNQVHDISWVFVSGIHGERLVVIFRCDGYKKNAGKLAEKTFAAMGSAGGHREAARAEVPLKNLPGEGVDFSTKTLMQLTKKHL